jgi:hypothetical protein
LKNHKTTKLAFETYFKATITQHSTGIKIDIQINGIENLGTESQTPAGLVSKLLNDFPENSILYVQMHFGLK